MPFDAEIATVDLSLVPPAGRHPYYLFAKPYTRFSAGIKAMHLLCHALNRRSQNAFILADTNRPTGAAAVNPELLTPLLSADIVDCHFGEHRTPVTIYPEVVWGNPLAAPLVVRYVLNFPGLLGGDAVYAPEELCFGYSRSLAKAARVPDNVLYIPTSDTSIFRPSCVSAPRRGTCFYAVKYRSFHPGKLVAPAPGSREITRAESPEEIATIFRRSELFYCYENSALALEAALCGCPVVFMPNEHLTEMIAGEIIGRDGYAWGDDPAEIARAKATIGKAGEHYARALGNFWDQLDRFIVLTQARAAATPYARPLEVSLPRASPWRCRLADGRAAVTEIVRREGMGGFLRRAARRAGVKKDRVLR